MRMTAVQATLATAVWIAATAAMIGFAGPASADPAVGPCDPQALTVAQGQSSAGLGHRAVLLNFALPSGAGPCQLSGYPTVDAFVETEVDVEGASPIHAKRTPTGYLAHPYPAGPSRWSPATAPTRWSNASRSVHSKTQGARSTGPPVPMYGYTCPRRECRRRLPFRS